MMRADDPRHPDNQDTSGFLTVVAVAALALSLLICAILFGLGVR